MNDPSAPRPTARVADRTLGGGELFVIAGPCLLESAELALGVAEHLAETAQRLELPLVFKGSFDKANRTSASSARGPGLEEGLDVLAEVKRRTGLPVLTDVHLPEQCAPVAEVCDVLQIPAFLCRQTDLVVAAARTNRCVNVKKGQFLAPWDLVHATRKCEAEGNGNVLVTERGSSFGYGRLVVDMTGLVDLSATGHPVVLDATHSVQRPGTLEGRTGGDRTLAPLLARAAVATGHVDGLFFEVHPDPDNAPSDGPNMLELETVAPLLEELQALHRFRSERVARATQR